MAKVFMCFLIVFMLWGTSNGKIFTRCELAEDLMKYSVFKKNIDDWVCLIENGSKRNSTAVKYDSDGIKHYGLFQIDGGLWCGDKGIGGICKIKCKSLLVDDGVGAAAKCVKKVTGKWKALGLYMWNDYVKDCKGRFLPNVKAECDL